jgi:hypothetical protein
MSRYQIYETKRKPRRTGTPPSAGGATDAAGRIADSDRPYLRCITSVPTSLARHGPGRSKGLGRQATSRPKTPTERRPTVAIGKSSVKRGPSVWLGQQPLDCCSCNRDGSPVFRDKTSSRTRPQHSEATVGLDQPEARTPGPRTRRERNCSLARPRISPYKKTPLAEGPTWSSPMNRVSCSRPRFAEPWLLAARRPFTIAGNDGIASRPSVPSPSVLFANAADCTLPCWQTMRMFTHRMWSAFCVSLSVMFRVRLRLSGTAARCMIAPRWFRLTWPSIPKLSLKNFRHMLRNSTQMNRSGLTSNTLVCPITPRTISGNFAIVLGGNCGTCVGVLICWLHSYIMQKSLLGFKQCLVT